jgi:hypothetical protein
VRIDHALHFGSFGYWIKQGSGLDYLENLGIDGLSGSKLPGL